MNLAALLDAVPVVQSTADRAVRFPTPATDQRVYNKTTKAIERWNGAAWVVDFGAGGALVFQGAGSPEGVVTAGPGALYLQTDGAGNNAWLKTSGAGNTNWKLLVLAGVTAATIFADSLVGTNISGGWIQQQQAPITFGAGSTHNYDPAFITTLLATANAGGSTLTGIAATQAGRQLRIIKLAGGTLTIANQNVGSTAVNRIITGTGADIVIATDGAASFDYDATTQRWRVVATH